MPIKCSCRTCDWIEILEDIEDKEEVDEDQLRLENCDNRCNSKIYKVSVIKTDHSQDSKDQTDT